MRKLNKRGVMEQLGGLVQGLAFMAILLAVGFLIVAESQDQALSTTGNNDSFAVNATEDVTNALADIPQWLPI